MLARADVQPQNSPAETRVIAHRGSWKVAAENSLEAFAEAISLGAEMIEFDVRQTGDGRLVIHHDPELDAIPLAAVRHTALDSPRRVATPPLLEDVLELARDRVAVNVEFKEPDCVATALPALRRFGLDRCLVTSFIDATVAEAKASEPALRTGLLVGRSAARYIVRFSELFPLPRLRRTGADVLVLHQRLADTGLIQRAAHAGKPCIVWTVNDERRLERYLADPRICAVITDEPALALQRRSALSSRTAPAALC